MVRLTKYIRTGDNGTTALGDGTRIEKFSLRVVAYGTVDELNSNIVLQDYMYQMTLHPNLKIFKTTFSTLVPICNPNRMIPCPQNKKT